MNPALRSGNGYDAGQGTSKAGGTATIRGGGPHDHPQPRVAGADRGCRRRGPAVLRGLSARHGHTGHVGVPDRPSGRLPRPPSEPGDRIGSDARSGSGQFHDSHRTRDARRRRRLPVRLPVDLPWPGILGRDRAPLCRAGQCRDPVPPVRQAGDGDHLLGVVADGGDADARHFRVYRCVAAPGRARQHGHRACAELLRRRGATRSRWPGGPRDPVAGCAWPWGRAPLPGAGHALAGGQAGALAMRDRAPRPAFLGPGHTPAPQLRHAARGRQRSQRPLRHGPCDRRHRGGVRDAVPRGWNGRRAGQRYVRRTHRRDPQGPRHSVHPCRFRIRPAVRPVADRGGPRGPRRRSASSRWR